jgi:hypothetical protein
MKRFIRNLFIFLVLFFIFSIILDFFLSQLLKQSKQYPSEFEVMNEIYASNANAEVAIYGSSRAWVQFNPQILSDSLQTSVYNYGIDGHNFYLQYLRHLELIKHNSPPKKIIFSIDVFSFQIDENLYHLEQFLPYMLWNPNIYRYTKAYNGFEFYDYFIPLVRYAGKWDVIKLCFDNLIEPEANLPYRNNGFLGMDRQWDESRKYALKDSFQIQIDSTCVGYFDAFLKETKDMGIEVILVYAPEHTLGQALISNRNEIISFYSYLAKNNQIQFLNYSKHAICQDKQLFYNASHLNAHGATIFSKVLASDLKNIIH